MYCDFPCCGLLPVVSVYKFHDTDVHMCTQTHPKNFSTDNIHLIWQHPQICRYVTGNLWRTRKREVLQIILRSRQQDYVCMSHRTICHLDWSYCIAGSNSRCVNLRLCRLFASAKSEQLISLLHPCHAEICFFSKMRSQAGGLPCRCETFTFQEVGQRSYQTPHKPHIVQE